MIDQKIRVSSNFVQQAVQKPKETLSLSNEVLQRGIGD